MARPVGTLNKKGRYSKNSIYAAVMEQLEYWQAIEDGAEFEEESKKTKKKKKNKKKNKEKAKKQPTPAETVESENTVDAAPEVESSAS
jgi:hypothetical protein